MRHFIAKQSNFVRSHAHSYHWCDWDENLMFNHHNNKLSYYSEVDGSIIEDVGIFKTKEELDDIYLTLTNNEIEWKN